MKDGYYDRLTADQVSTFYRLINLLRRLRAIGVLYAETVGATQEIEILGVYDIVDMTNAIYGIKKLAYSPDKGAIKAEEILENVYGRLSQKMRGSP